MNRTSSQTPARAAAPRPREARTEVTGEDLTKLDVLRALLLTLNDPAASARAIAFHVEQYPVLRARIEARYRQRYDDAGPSLASQIVMLGNRELEAILLAVLEDVVTLHSENAAVQQ